MFDKLFLEFSGEQDKKGIPLGYSDKLLLVKFVSWLNENATQQSITPTTLNIEAVEELTTFTKEDFDKI